MAEATIKISGIYTDCSFLFFGHHCSGFLDPNKFCSAATGILLFVYFVYFYSMINVLGLCFLDFKYAIISLIHKNLM